MTEESLLTKCPHCETLFRIKQEHLTAAGGEVRCGVCYKVFDAENEGMSYSQGEGSPREKTFARRNESSADKLSDDNDEIIDTSPEPEEDPQQALVAANIDLALNQSPLSPDEVKQFNVSHSSISGIIATNSTANNKGALLKWGAFNLLAMVILITQWLFFNFEKNVQQLEWRPLYAKACQLLDCELPLYQSIAAVKTERLVIKSHPEYNNVLIVDMIISNTAQYSQPLPLLNMSFSNLNGEPMAQRLFEPHEYLGPQLQQLSLMPAKTPIHLSFAILDPGSKAVNYTVSFTPAS